MTDTVVTIELVIVEDDVVVVDLAIPEGRLRLMAEVAIEGGVIRARGTHIHGEGLAAGDLGLVRLRQIARAVLEETGYDEAIVEGGVRTTGARPGRRPKPLRFQGKPGAAPR